MLTVALIVRATFLIWPHAYHADEIFQYLEQAHRIVFGYGAVPWESRLGIRNPLFPEMLAGPMRLGDWLWPTSDAYLLLPKLCLVLVSLLSVWAAWTFGRRISPRHGAAAAIVAALWPEFAQFAGQALTDALAVPLILTAAALIDIAKGQKGRWQNALAGALLAAAALLRAQYGPAELALVAVALWQSRKWDAPEWISAAWIKAAWIGAGAVAVLAAYCLFEVQAGRMPFEWIAASWHQNLIIGRSHQYGDRFFGWYIPSLFIVWTLWAVPIVALSALVARRYPALMAMAVTNILVHSLIAHKEYRFILLSTMTLLLLAAIGSVEWVQRRPLYWPTRWPERRSAIMAAFWISGALACALMPFQAKFWSKARPGIQAYSYLRKEPGVCGIAHYEARWTHGGGYAYLHRPLPIYLPDFSADPEADLANGQANFNVIIAPPQPRHPLPRAYRKETCFGLHSLYRKQALCIYRRPGPCANADAGAGPLNAALVRADK